MAQQVGIEFLTKGGPEFQNIVKGMGTATTQAFTTITQSAKGLTTETKTVQNVMGATVTTVTKASQATGGFTTALKNNILSLSIAASSIIGLVQQYTALSKARLTMEKAGVAEAKAHQAVIDKTQALRDAIDKYGQASEQAVDASNKLKIAQDAAGLAAERHTLLQEQFNERLAEFATQILPNLIGAFGSITQVIQGFKAAQQEATTVTTIAGEAQAVLNAQESIGMATTAGLATETKLLAGAQKEAGVAASFMGSKMKLALIGTGIGAILVAIGTALAAFTENWYGFRDAVNAAGVEIGKMAPQLIPLLNLIKQFGDFLLKVFGVDLGLGVDSAISETQRLSEATKKAAKEVADAWQNMLDPFKMAPDAKHKDWKEQFKMLKDLGFDKSGVHKIKIGIDMVQTQEDVFKKLQTGLTMITKFHLPPSDVRKWANNIIDDLNKGIKEHPELEPVLGPIKELIKNNKKSPFLPQMILDQFTKNPVVAQALSDLGIEIDPAFTDAVTKATAAAKAVHEAWMKKQVGFTTQSPVGDVTTDPLWRKALGLDTTDTAADLDQKAMEKGKTMITKIAEGIKAGADVFNGAFDFLMTTVTTGMDEFLKGAGAGGAAYFSIGWQSYKQATDEFNKWAADSWAAAYPTLQGLGAGAAYYFGVGWQTFKDIGVQLNDWIAQAQAYTIPTIQGLGAGAAQYFSLGWQSLTQFGSDVSDWIVKSLDSSSQAWNKFLQLGKDIGGQVQLGIQSVFGDWAWLKSWIVGNPPAEGITPENAQQIIDNKKKKQQLIQDTHPARQKEVSDWWNTIQGGWNWLMNLGKPQEAFGSGGPTGIGKNALGIGSVPESVNKKFGSFDISDLQKKGLGGGGGGGGGKIAPMTIPAPDASKFFQVIDECVKRVQDLGGVVLASQKYVLPAPDPAPFFAIIDAAVVGVVNLSNVLATTPMALPTPDVAPFFAGIDTAIEGAVNVVQVVAGLEIQFPAPILDQFGEGLNEAMNVAQDAVKRIIKILAKTVIGASDLEPFGDGLNEAQNAAKDAVKRINKILSKTKVGAPDLSDFGSGLNEAIGAAKDAARRINAALASTKIPHAGGGIYSFAEGGVIPMAGGGMKTSGSRQRFGPFEWAERGNETMAFIPHNNPWPILDRLNAMFGGGKGSGSEGNLSGQIATLLGSLRIPVTIVLQLPTREIVEEVEIHLGQNIRRM